MGTEEAGERYGGVLDEVGMNRVHTGTSGGAPSRNPLSKKIRRRVPNSRTKAKTVDDSAIQKLKKQQMRSVDSSVQVCVYVCVCV